MVVRMDLALICGLTTALCASSVLGQAGGELTDWLFFASDQRLGAIRPDGTGECYPLFSLPQQRQWRLGEVSGEGRELELAAPDTGKTYRYDVVTRQLTETSRAQGLPLPGGTRWLQVSNEHNTFSLYTTDADGGGREEVYSTTGLAYCATLSPEGQRLAYHITNNPARPGYEICVVDLVRRQHRVIASDHRYLHFGPTWSPDGAWLLYQRCEHQQDPGHDRSDLFISRPDGSEHRQLTRGQSHWFAAAVGTPERHSSGSNMPVWSPDGRHFTCALLLPDSRTAWPWAVGRPDTDHFNRDYHPELARGGTQICQVDIATGRITPLSADDPPTWHFRLAWSPDGKQLAHMRADVGTLPELWIRDADGGNPRRLTSGLEARGADHPRWVRLAVPAL